MPGVKKIGPSEYISSSCVTGLAHAQYFIARQYVAPHIEPTDAPHKALWQDKAARVSKFVLVLTNY